MSSVNVSVILPAVSSAEKFNRFCSSLFSGKLSTELLVCDNSGKLIVNEKYSEFVSTVSSENKTEALNAALGAVKGKFVIIADESVIFAPEALEKLIVASAGSSAVCNAGIISDGKCHKAFIENFESEDAASKPIYFNHLLSADVIRKNQLLFCGSDELSVMLFLADYYRYDDFVPVREVLMYNDEIKRVRVDEALVYLSEYAEAFRLTGNLTATMFFLSAVLSALLPMLNEQLFTVLKDVVNGFGDDRLLMSWIKSAYGIDTKLLCGDSVSFVDFSFNGSEIYYREVSLPIVPDAVVRNFYSGKYGVDMLKKCIGAWLHYKFYCRKDGKLKTLGCKLSRKLLGGDFVG